MSKQKIISVAAQKSIRFVLFAVALVFYLAGCSTGPQVKTASVFFPPEPNLPRIQYLMGISDSRNIEAQKDSFSLLLLGQSAADSVKTIRKPYGITINKGKIYVCDVGSQSVVIIDPVNKAFDHFRGDKGQGTIKRPSNVAFDPEGNMFVADGARKAVLEYNPSLKFVRTLGSDMDITPIDVAVHGNFVYVLDVDHNQIAIIDKANGNLLRTIGKATETTPGLAIPTSLALDTKGMLYTTNMGSGSVIKLDPDGHIVTTFGKMGDGFGDFSRPKGVAVDKEGRIYVVDNGLQNVQVFSDTARLLIFFGDPGLPVGSLKLPVGIGVANENIDYYQKLAAPGFILEQVIFVTSQFGDNKISIYGLGKMKGLDYEPKPAEGAAKPAEGAAKPAEGAAKPAEGAAKPAEGAAKPAEGAAKPAEEKK